MSLTKDVVAGSIKVDGVNVNYYEASPSFKKGKIETIVLLHGTGGSAKNNFWALFPMLALRHRVIAFDFVDLEEEIPNKESYIAQALAVINHISDGKPVHLVGYSFGAVIAASFAAKYNELLSSLTLVAGWAKTDNHQKIRNSIWHDLYERKSESLKTFTLLNSFTSGFINSKNDKEIEDLIENIGNGDDRVKKMLFNKDVDISTDLEKIKVESLVVGCIHDQMVPIFHSRILFGSIEDCRYAEINSGHGVVHERPSELFLMIDEFVKNKNHNPPGTIIKNLHA